MQLSITHRVYSLEKQFFPKYTFPPVNVYLAFRRKPFYIWVSKLIFVANTLCSLESPDLVLFSNAFITQVHISLPPKLQHHATKL